MTHRERFVRLFTGEPVDRAPFIDYMGKCNFGSCLTRWKKEGLPEAADREDIIRIIGFDYSRGYYLNAKLLFYPEFEVSLIKNEGDLIYRRNKWGGLELQKEGSELMPLTLEGPVCDRYSWDSVKERLAGSIPERMPPDFNRICEEAAVSGLPVYAGDLPAGFFGGLREILGFENLMCMFYDDRDLLSEILDTVCDLWIDVYAYMQKRVALDYIFIWEDMCDKNGPMTGLRLFREFLLPRYVRLIKSLRANGCRLFMVDSDGDARPLVPLWMESGVNIVVPWETQFGLDIREVRNRHPGLGIIGGLNKHVLEFTREMMDAELEKVPYMLERGYYIPSLDHGVTNNVSWYNYTYFYDRLKRIIGA